jgi:hypothetical protein
MSRRHGLVGLVGLLALVGPGAELCLAQNAPQDAAGPPLFAPAAPAAGDSLFGAPHVPLETIPGESRQRIQAVLDQPTLASKGRSETFNADPVTYRWLLAHPDQAARLWRLIGAKVSDIKEANGMYLYQEGQSEVRWHIAYHDHVTHAWYADGKVKLGLLLPASSFRAWVVLEYKTGKDTAGKPAIRQQVHFLLRCDGRAVALAARILGASAPHLAEQYLGQLQMFYGGLAWYLWQDRDRARQLFRQIGFEHPLDQTP